MESMSVGIASGPLTFGFRAKASTSTDTHPAAIMGFNDVNGAARAAVIIATFFLRFAYPAK